MYYTNLQFIISGNFQHIILYRIYNYIINKNSNL